MRNILTLLISLLSFVAVSAQTQGHNIVIDESSLTPVQTDALSGVAIDKIGKDTSQRPCARLKIHINRMTRAELDELSLHFPGGNIVEMKRAVNYEGNGLIVELTAKQATRFYLHHDKYGDSNEVSLNLEGDKEYKLSAQLNFTHSIVVSSNVVNAEVYLDGEYMGRTDDSFTLTVNDVTPGVHRVKVQSGVSVNEKEIEVSSASIHFRIEVNTATSRAQYVVFNVVPVDAVVLIDNKDYTPDANGVVMLSLQNGTYTYEVLANEHHSAKGTFLVSGAKVVERVELKPAYGWLSVGGSGTLANAKIYVDNKLIGTTPITRSKLSSGTHSIRVVKSMYHTLEDSITIRDNEELKYTPTLVADFATVTFDAGSGCDIYINDERKGPSPWTGKVASGTYIVEARKDGHRTTTLSQSISATPSKQTYKLDAPTPILGTINVTSTPLMADIYVDGKLVGETPLIYDLLVGTHEISVQMSGYRKSTQRVTIAENKTENLNISLQKGSDNTDNTKNNVIEYVMPNKKMKISNAYSMFGANIKSHTWDSATGKGVITFMNDVTTIGKNAFSGCCSLTSVTIPDSVTTIGKYAFFDCSSLTSVTIPNSVTTIGYAAFYECSSLTSVTIPDSVTTIGNAAFSGCTSLTSVTIGDGVTTTGKATFYNCCSLTSVNIPDSVTTIGYSAFWNCRSLTSVTIPDSVTTIGKWAFQRCRSLTSVYCKPTIQPSICISALSNIASSRKIYVPMQSVEQYKRAKGWKKYKDAIEGYNF